MYKKEAEGWFKHFDFILLDMICLQLAFWLAYGVRGLGWNPYTSSIYRNMALIIELADIIVILSFGTFKGVLKRGHYKEFLSSAHHTVLIGMAVVAYLFAFQKGEEYSRLVIGYTLVFYLLLTYVTAEIWKQVLKKRRKNVEERSLLIVTTSDIVNDVVDNIQKNNLAGFRLAGLVLMDQDMTGKKKQGVPVVASAETAAQYVCQAWVDEVLIVPSESFQYPQELIEQFEETGVVIHMNLAKVSNKPGKKQFVEKIGNYTVLTTSMNYASARALVVKRLMDIAGGLAGCLLTALIFVIVAPVIYISSPGPIFFSQERVGKNGKRFKIYKFRSMYMDAEARKAELMKENKLGDGKMFKLDFDPRVIGNKILPDGRKKTGIGDFIRKTSLDEFPQFWNVLKGDMSLVGTRPPLPGEVSLYELHHRVRLAIKPGITGMWQVSGRSDITDFEEVVRLDKEYIDRWNIGLDVKILLKTVMVVFRRDGSV